MCDTSKVQSDFLLRTCGFWLREHHPLPPRFPFTVRLQHTVAAIMATSDMTALPLQQFIASLDSTCLPKILQVCSGVYFQGKSVVILLTGPKPVLFLSVWFTFCFRVGVWNLWEWSVLLHGGSHESHWHRVAVRLLWRRWEPSDVWVANYSHRFVPTARKILTRKANPASLLT